MLTFVIHCFILLYLHGYYACVYVWALLDASCPQRLEAGIRGSRTTVTDGCKLRGDVGDWSQVLWKSSLLPFVFFVYLGVFGGSTKYLIHFYSPGALATSQCSHTEAILTTH